MVEILLQRVPLVLEYPVVFTRDLLDPENTALSEVLDRFAALRLDRHAFVVGIGGGAALDVIGYASAILHRGLRLVRVPTTVLAQNDAGIGVKNGINAYGAKNM